LRKIRKRRTPTGSRRGRPVAGSAVGRRRRWRRSLLDVFSRLRHHNSGGPAGI